MTELEKLQHHLDSLGPVAVAVSGGVDSMTLAVVANRVNKQSEFFHALSPAVPTSATERVKKHAKKEGWNLKLIRAGEMDDPAYLANPVNRCYYCKSNLYDAIQSHTDFPVVSGTNTDDLGDYRPGLIAAKERLVSHPYVDVGISKIQLRRIAKTLGLDDLHSLPAAPCLSSRITTKIPIDKELLPVIDAAEEQLWQALRTEIPINAIRCRIRPGEVAIEIDSGEETDYMNSSTRIIQIVRDLFTQRGYAAYCKQISIEPYKRGSAFLIDAIHVE